MRFFAVLAQRRRTSTPPAPHAVLPLPDSTGRFFRMAGKIVLMLLLRTIVNRKRLHLRQQLVLILRFHSLFCADDRLDVYKRQLIAALIRFHLARQNFKKRRRRQRIFSDKGDFIAFPDNKRNLV